VHKQRRVHFKVRYQLVLRLAGCHPALCIDKLCENALETLPCHQGSNLKAVTIKRNTSEIGRYSPGLLRRLTAPRNDRLG
jgi:hypothetical protein